MKWPLKWQLIWTSSCAVRFVRKYPLTGPAPPEPTGSDRVAQGKRRQKLGKALPDYADGDRPIDKATLQCEKGLPRGKALGSPVGVAVRT